MGRPVDTTSSEGFVSASMTRPARAPASRRGQRHLRWLPPRHELVAIVVVVAAFMAAALWLIAMDTPLGHDEAAYAERAREIELGQPKARFFVAYRAPGLPWLLSVMPVGLGGSRFRAVVLLFGVVLVVATWLLGRILVGPRAGLVAAALLALTPTMLLASTLVLPDVPGAAVGMVALVVFAAALERASLPWWVWSIVPLAVAATYLRFGSPLPIAVGLGVLALARWGRVREQLAHVVALGAATAAGMAAVLVVPALTGSSTSPRAAIAARQAAKDRAAFGSLKDFWLQAPDNLGLVLVILAAVVMTLVIVRLLVRDEDVDRGTAVALAIGVLTMGALGYTLGHAETRYTLPVLPLLWIVAGSVLVHLAVRVLRSVAVVTSLVVVVLGSLVAVDQTRAVHEQLDRRFAVLAEAATATGTRPDLPCPVVTSYSPQYEWYSGCEAAAFADGRVPDRFGGRDVSLVLVRNGKRQPSREAVEKRHGPPDLTVGTRKRSLQMVDVWRVDAP